MLFYRVKPQADQLPKNPWRPADILVANELLTQRAFQNLPVFRECNRRGIPVPKLYENAFEKVIVPARRTHVCFGARFADENAVVFRVN